MKIDTLRELPDQELNSKVDELREELFNFRFRHATGQLDNPMMLKLARRNLSMALTVRHERELGYFSLRELESVRGALGLPIERDLYWRPKTLREIAPALFSREDAPTAP